MSAAITDWTAKRDAIANAFIAFAAMMKEDYGISKEAAVLAIKAAYDTNADHTA